MISVESPDARLLLIESDRPMLHEEDVFDPFRVGLAVSHMIRVEMDEVGDSKQQPGE